MTSVRLTPAQERVLRSTRDGEVEYSPVRFRTGGAQSAEYWTDWSVTYGPKRCTAAGKRLKALGLVEVPSARLGHADFSRYAELTPAGRQWLADHPEES